jgi:hypothetical protein
VSRLRKMMLEELQRRNYSAITTRNYLVRIRHFGFLANRFRASHLALGRQLLGSSLSSPQQVPPQQMHQSSSLWHCPRCGSTMVVIQRFTAAELALCIYFDSS